MSEGASLLAYCRMHPEDDGARRVYADWLEENGDPERAAFIRLQLDRGGRSVSLLDGDDAFERERALMAAHGRRWLAELPVRLRGKARFDRGLPTRFTLTTKQLLQNRRAFRSGGVAAQSLRLEGDGGMFGEVVASGLLAGVRELELGFAWLSEGDAARLTDCADLAGLRRLSLRAFPASEEACRRLARSRHLAGLESLEFRGPAGSLIAALEREEVAFRLRHLRLIGGQGGPLDLSPLTRGRCFAALQEVSVWAHLLEPGGLAALASSPVLGGLRHLQLSSCGLTDQGAGLLAGARAAPPRLDHLDLSFNALTDAGADSLARSPVLGAVKELGLEGNPAGDAALATLAETGPPALETLDLSRTPITDAGVLALARSRLWQRLKRLRLSFAGGVTDASVVALFAGQGGEPLRGFDLFSGGVGPDGARAIAASPRAAGLARLWLGYNHLGPDGAAALAGSPHLGGLRKLHLCDNAIGDRGAEALWAAPWLDGVTFLGLETNRLSRAMKRRYRERRGGRTWQI